MEFSKYLKYLSENKEEVVDDITFETFIANLKAAIRNNEKVEIGGGIFTKEELKKILEKLKEVKS